MKLDRAISLAKKQDVSELSSTEAERMVEAALSRAPSSAMPQRNHWKVASVVLAAAAGILLWWSWASGAGGKEEQTRETAVLAPEAPVAGLPTRLQLPTGDELASSPGARFRVKEASVLERSIKLEAGTVLFSIVPLMEGQNFVVDAPGMQVRVTGTVFSVKADGDVSVVQVYEGSVEVMQDGHSHTLSAGERMHSNGLRGERESEPLASLALEIVAERVVLRNVPIPSPPSEVQVASAPDQSPATSVSPEENGHKTKERLVPQAEEGAKRVDAEVEAEEGAKRAEAEAEDLRTKMRAKGRELLATGKFDEAHALGVEQGIAILRGDALRAQGNNRGAVAAYIDAKSATGDYLAAELLVNKLDKPRTGGQLLVSRAVHDSSLRERAIALQMKAAFQAGDTALSKTVAKTYLERFPNGGARGFAEKLLTH